MKFKDYSDEIIKQIETKLASVLHIDPKPVAAFDADGTLWDTDLGEEFFKYQIKNKLVELPANAWDHYHQLKKKNNDPREAYLWLAQICRGKNISEVRKWADQAVSEKKHLPIFDAQKKLIEFFLSRNVEVYIVTASVKWAVEPGARLLGLQNENVLGVETAIENELVTLKPFGQMTYREGKAKAIIEKTNGKKPFFCCGNTMGDFELIKSATHLKLAVSGAKESDSLYQTELLLQSEAQKNNWLRHRFV